MMMILFIGLMKCCVVIGLDAYSAAIFANVASKKANIICLN